MSLSIVVSDDDIFNALGNFLVAILPLAPSAVLQGQENRVAEPGADDYVLMIPLRRTRLRTNVDAFTDDAWQGGVTGVVMTVTKLLAGSVKQGAKPGAWPALAANTTVGAQLSGTPGGLGTYSIAPAQAVAADTIFQAGAGSYEQGTQITVQLEVHGPNSADNAQIISTMMRDDYAFDFFGGQSSAISPLYADDPKQMPFNNDQQQVENRWVIECELQANITVMAPQQFFDQVVIGLKNVDVEFPPS